LALLKGGQIMIASEQLAKAMLDSIGIKSTLLLTGILLDPIQSIYNPIEIIKATGARSRVVSVIPNLRYFDARNRTTP
jgi:hypothetical protein